MTTKQKKSSNASKPDASAIQKWNSTRFQVIKEGKGEKHLISILVCTWNNQYHTKSGLQLQRTINI